MTELQRIREALKEQETKLRNLRGEKRELSRLHGLDLLDPQFKAVCAKIRPDLDPAIEAVMNEIIRLQTREHKLTF